MTFHICHAVTPEMTCRFSGACYGEICIGPSICSKAEADLTDEDRAAIARIDVEMNGPSEEIQQ